MSFLSMVKWHEHHLNSRWVFLECKLWRFCLKECGKWWLGNRVAALLTGSADKKSQPFRAIGLQWMPTLAFSMSCCMAVSRRRQSKVFSSSMTDRTAKFIWKILERHCYNLRKCGQLFLISQVSIMDGRQFLLFLLTMIFLYYSVTLNRN